MATYVGVGLAVLVGIFLIVAPALKNIIHWRSKPRDLALNAVQWFSEDLDTDNSEVRAELCGRMLSYLRSDVEYCLARYISIRTIALSAVFFALYLSCRIRILLRRPPRKIDALCSTVRRLSASVR